MVKQINNVEIKITNTPEEGNPDTIEVFYQINDSADTKMIKQNSYIVESPNFTETVQTMWDNIITNINSIEGIS